MRARLRFSFAFAVLVAVFFFALPAARANNETLHFSADGNTQTGCDIEVLTYTINVDGAPDGQYYLDDIYGSANYTINVVHGVASPSTITHNLLCYQGGNYASWTAGNPSGYTASYYITAVRTYTKTIASGSWGDSATWQAAKDGGPTNDDVKNIALSLATGTHTGKNAVFNVDLVGNDGKSHTVVLMYNGMPVDTFTLPAGTKGGANMVSTGSFTYSDANNGDAYSWVVDGVAGGNGVVTLADGALSFTAPTLQAKWSSSLPSSTPAPTPGPTNNGNTTTSGNNTNPDGSGQSQGTTVNNNNTTIGGGSTGATNQDLYNDVLQALKDNSANAGSGNNSEEAAVALPDSTFTPADFSDRGHLDDLQGQLDGIKGQADGLQSSLTSTVSALGNMVTLIPTGGFGTVSTIDFGTVHIGQSDCSFAINLGSGSQWGSSVSTFRTAVLWCLTIGWISLLVFTVRRYV